MRELILASQSPRRRELLQREGYQFRTLSVEISEIFKENLNLESAVEDVARRKAEALVNSGKLSEIKNFLVLSGDTIVLIDGKVLGKPENEEVAAEYLRKLSGKTHRVITAVCLWDGPSSEVITANCESKITFEDLSDDQILSYVKTGDPMDKAGAYGIQSVDRGFIKKIEGSVANVMGLPVELVNDLIAKGGWEVERK